MASVLKVDSIKSLAGNEALTISEAGVATFAAPTVVSDIPVIEVRRSNNTTGAVVGSWTKLTTNYDTPTILSGGTFSGGVFTPNIPGYYQVNGIVFTSTSTNNSLWGAAIFLNDVLYANAYVRTNPSTSTGQNISVSYIVPCNGSTDTIGIGYFIAAGTPNGLSGIFSACLLQRTA